MGRAPDRGNEADAGAGRDGASAAGLPDLARLQAWARELGFDSLGVADVDLREAEPGLLAWLEAGHHGAMDYMARHGLKRARPAELVPGTVSAVMVSIDYAPDDAGWVDRAWRLLEQPERAYVSRYALGRDYHKVVRARLQRLADRIAQAVGPFGHRVFCDSGPVMEVELARRAGLGWRGKHTLLIDARRGSTFFLGTLFTDLPLAPASPPTADGAHCGTCTRCIDLCPTGAIVAPFRVDARRCISYLTIESPDPIPEDLRPRMGNRIYGCDDCQLACPWNGFARPATLPDFAARAGLDGGTLVELFGWDRATFERRTEGSAIRRIGHERWLRNLAVAMGNAPADPRLLAALRARADDPSPLVREHVAWAIARQAGLSGPATASPAASPAPRASTP